MIQQKDKNMKTFITILSFALAVYCNAQTLTLSSQECRKMALEHSEDLKIAANKVVQSGLDKKIARNTILPQLSGSAMGIYLFPDMDLAGTKMSMKGAWTAGFSLTQPIYLGGKIRASMKMSKIGAEAATEQERAMHADVMVDADNAYWTYIAVLEKRRMVRSLIDYINSIYTQVETSLAVEMSTKVDLLRVEAKRSDLKYQLEKVENGVEMCRMSLCNIIGVGFDTEIVLSDTAVIVDKEAVYNVGDGITMRPEYHLLQKQVDLSKQQIRMIRADYLPTLALSANYSWYGNIKMKGMADMGDGTMIPFTRKYDSGQGMVMLSLNVPIWNWNEGRKKIRKQRLEVENSRLELAKSTRLMTIELENARKNLMSSNSLIVTAEAGEKDATEALRIMKDRFEVGMCTLTDLLEAQSQWHTAKSNVIEARTQYKIYETDYLKTAGILE